MVKGKAAAFPGPRNLDTFNAMPRAPNPRYLGSNIAVMLGKVQMPPSHRFEVMGFA